MGVNMKRAQKHTGVQFVGVIFTRHVLWNTNDRAGSLKTTPKNVEERVMLRLPTFVSKNPHVWFAQVEAVFDLHRVTSETTRYRHLLCNLPPEVADEVAYVIGAPLNDAPYQRLKQSFLDRTTVSESARLRHLLTHEELGDRRPSQLLNTMRQLVGASNVDSNGALLKQLFLQRLPQSTRIV
ncbi:hypothetical protein HPB48_019327 [Haemaphysalis longicornis]|uniref:DUF7041 domain-containing protein n=1 Tax=Haemaphysalis longicornis TaxID=44386 RepID=A0A9J6GUT7_HAELO|nr:hypothetical protein HPB48_019327 [Haemaphysalis longicornis]